MTGLIKGSAAGFDARIRPLAFGGGAGTGAPAPDPELIELRRCVLDLEARLAERDAAAKASACAAEAAFAEGEAAGREAGRLEADERRAEALDLLRTAADRAVAMLGERLGATDRLAALLALTCLDKMFGETEARSDLVGGLIGRQLETLRAETIVEIRVSADDFESPEAASAAAPACTVIVSDALASGDCAIRLRLGTLDIGLGQQWGALRASLEAMADGREAA